MNRNDPFPERPLGPEVRRVFPRLTVEENLWIGAYVYQEHRQVLEELD